MNMTKTAPKEVPFYQELIAGETKRFAPKKVKSLQVDIVNIGPEQARHILRYYNNRNRRPSKVVVSKYSTDMLNGSWKRSGQTISFDCTGGLLDGQHRLLAVANTGIPQEFVAIYGLAPDAIEVIDNGKIRTTGDTLDMNGYNDSNVLASLSRAIIAYQTNGALNQQGFRQINQITKSQVVDFLDKNKNVIGYLDRYKKSQVVSQSIAAFCYWLLSTVDKDQAEAYLDEVFLGYGLQPDTIQSYLFNKLQRNKNAMQNKMDKTAIISNVILGWRRYMGYSKSTAMQITWDTRRGIPKPN